MYVCLLRPLDSVEFANWDFSQSPPVQVLQGLEDIVDHPKQKRLKTAPASCSNVIIFKVGGPNLTLSLKLLLSSVPLPEFLTFALTSVIGLDQGWATLALKVCNVLQRWAPLLIKHSRKKWLKSSGLCQNPMWVCLIHCVTVITHCGHKYRPQNSAGPWGPELSTIRLCCPHCWRCDVLKPFLSVLGIPVMLFGLGGHSVGATGAFGNHFHHDCVLRLPSVTCPCRS